jgi:Integrase core domain
MALHRAGQAVAERLRESFNGKLRNECLNKDVLATLAEACAVIGRWRHDYTTSGRTRRTADSPPKMCS